MFSGDKRLVGTYSSSKVEKDVIETGKSHFYGNMIIDDEKYFAYYHPVFNSDGKCIGMVFAGKPVKDVNRDLQQAILPSLIISILAIFVMAVICVAFAKKNLSYITLLKNFMKSISEGDLSVDLDKKVTSRNDEIGIIGRAAIDMQKSLRIVVEQDVLTKVNNRRKGEKILEMVVDSANQKGIKYALAMGDIDHFKNVNDTYGHDCGDIVLRGVAHILKKNMIGNGYVARWGGEEFLLIFENKDEKEACIVLEKILDDIRANTFEFNDEKIKVTMTFGLENGERAVDGNVILKKSDEKLYYGKNSGRNRIIR